MKTRKINTLLILLILFIAATYLPLIMHGGITVDDWGDISHNLSCGSFIDCYGTWFPLFSNRPLAPLPITALTFTFKLNYSGYLFANTFIYLLAVALCARVISQISSHTTAIAFSAFASIPMIAMPLIASPINQSTATVSFLFWSLSLLSLLKFIRTTSIQAFITSNLWLLLAFLTYEVILPLLILNLFLSFIVKPETLLKSPLQYALRYLLPILLVLFLVTAWQKGIAPQFMEVDSRLKFQPSHIIPKIHTWAHVFYSQIPMLFWRIPRYLNLANLLTGLLLAILLWCCGKQNINDDSKRTMGRRFAAVSFLSFLASCSIFILSDESAVSSGYQARGLSSAWFAFAMLLATTFLLVNNKKNLLIFSFSCLGLFSSLSFGVQRNQYIQSWQLQSQIIRDVSVLIKSNNLSAPAIIIGNVPKYLENNYNDEIVFSQPWDFGAALALNTNGVVVDGFPIDIGRNDLRLITATENTVSAQNWTGSNFQNLWFYNFDINVKKGSLVRVTNSKQLFDLIQ